MYHCDCVQPHCRMIHHEFVEAIRTPLSKDQIRQIVVDRLRGIEFDIQTLMGVDDGRRNAGPIEVLRAAFAEYSKQLDDLPK